MILRWLQSLATPCPWPLRRMGYLREQLAIEDRYRRTRGAWDPHLAASRHAVHEAIMRCQRRRTAVVLGAGLLHDVPLAELAARFDRVVLADILHLPKNRRLAQDAGGKVSCLEFDCTGAVDALWRAGKSMASEEAERIVREAEPRLPAEIAADCDLVLSMNLASQLGNLPAEWLARGRARDSGFSLRLRRAAALRHVDWLRGMPGERLLVADQALVIRERDGTESEREVIIGDGDIEPAQRGWIWHLAPIPEWDRHHHLELQVGEWRFPA